MGFVEVGGGSIGDLLVRWDEDTESRCLGLTLNATEVEGVR